ncbi:MAG: hypothetical protein ACKVRN_10130 [Pyrinomonadaceae bacterium]
MKFLSILLLIGIGTLAGCSTAANNGNAANMRGANTNTGYVTNANTNVRPVMRVNATNISPPSMNSVMGNSNTSRNPAATSNMKANDKKQ